MAQAGAGQDRSHAQGREQEYLGPSHFTLSHRLSLRRLMILIQSGALSLVGRVEIVLSLVETFIELKYFHSVATPALLCHKEPARRIQSPIGVFCLLLAGSLWHKG